MNSLSVADNLSNRHTRFIAFTKSSVSLKVLCTCLRFPTFQLKRQWKKKQIKSTQHTKPKAACAQRRGAIQRTKLALPVLPVLSAFWKATVLCTQAW